MHVTVYTAFWCPDCRTAKRFLLDNRIPFNEIDIESTPGAAEEILRQTGKRAIPQFVVNGRWVQPYRPGEGFLYDEIKELFGLSAVR
jgi:glutaredoxin